jgi:hypothetical protein
MFIAMSAAVFAQAQTPVEWHPRGFEELRQMASSKTEFTLDHSMLVFASKLDSDNEDLRRVIAGINELSVHRYRFPGPWAYDSQALSDVKEEYHSAGWKQLVNHHAKDGSPGITDCWIHFEHNAINNIAILVASAKEVNLVEVSGSISPLDLLHLSGHFGIPKIEGGVLVPNADGR